MGDPAEGGLADLALGEEVDLGLEVGEELVAGGVELVGEGLEGDGLVHGERGHGGGVVGGSADGAEHLGGRLLELLAGAALVGGDGGIKTLDALKDGGHDGVDGAELAGAELGGGG